MNALIHSHKIINENAALPVDFFAERTSDGIVTQYLIDSLEEHELPVVGTFVHNHILPGFRYRVRKLNGTDEYLFGGKALQLEAVGQGYGKRLTFESKDILKNDNYFWSDSNDTGFAFSIQVLLPGEEYEVHDCHGRCIGSFLLESGNEKQEVTGITIEESLVNVHVKVNFRGKLMLLPQTWNSLPINSLCGKEIPLMGSGIAMANRLSSTIKLLETDIDGSKIRNLLNIKLFAKKQN